MAEIPLTIAAIGPLPVPSGGAAAQADGAVRIGALAGSGDRVYGGVGTVYGSVTDYAGGANLPLMRRVRLHRQLDGIPLREVWSNAATGAYAFHDVDPSLRYFAVAFDHTEDKNAAIDDNLTPDIEGAP